jgi:malate dehydrogenase (oxaloacetate-decarboxylating)(NADP+)
MSSETHRGVKLLHDPVRNQGTGFTEKQRDLLGLRGLLPPRVQSQEEQVLRVLENLDRKSSDLERYIFLIGLQDRNETLFYRVAVDHLERIMPLIYTPTVGAACQEFGHIFRRPRGIFISANDRGRVRDVLRNWPHRDVRIAVVTDGERILGLGDLGAQGMGIPVGKLSLYTACAGIHPTHCLPIMLDVGTQNAALRNDPLYIGLHQERLEGEEYNGLVEELFEAMAEIFPRAIVQLEDFATNNAFRLLSQYRDRACVFDDDIQGTGAVALAGVISALGVTGDQLGDATMLFLGAGEAAVGIAELAVAAMCEEGLDEAEARKRCWFVDTKGLVTAQRRDQLAAHKLPFAHPHAPLDGLLEAVRALRPRVLIGASGAPATFTEEILTLMGQTHERPVIFALSNPTSKSECTAEQAYRATAGRALFASGSPFDPVTLGDQTFHPGQGNNAYIFPGVGLGAIASGATRITDEMFLAAARALTNAVTPEDLSLGRVYPALTRIREVSLRIAVAVAELAWEGGLATIERPENVEAYIARHMFDPVYLEDVSEERWRFP